MLEGWTTLGFMAAHTKRARLGLMVGGVHYRNPGLWVKAATTLDVLSGGRAWLGIGAAWNEDESRSLGFPFPPLGERFEMLEETLQIAHGMWTGERGTEGELHGRHSPRDAAAQLPAVAVTPQGPDHDRRRRREEDAAAGGASTPTPTNVFGSPEGDRPQVRDPRRALRRDRARPRRDRALDAPERSGSRPTAATGPRRRRRSSTASASCPMPAPSTSSSACPTSPTSTPSSWSAAT